MPADKLFNSPIFLCLFGLLNHSVFLSDGRYVFENLTQWECRFNVDIRASDNLPHWVAFLPSVVILAQWLCLLFEHVCVCVQVSNACMHVCLWIFVLKQSQYFRIVHFVTKSLLSQRAAYLHSHCSVNQKQPTQRHLHLSYTEMINLSFWFMALYVAYSLVVLIYPTLWPLSVCLFVYWSVLPSLLTWA